MKYFTDHIRPFLFEQSQSACGAINPGDWTNNNCESMNHIHKPITKWTPSKLPNLIESLYEYVQQQTTDLQRAIYHEGDFGLTPANAKLGIKKCYYIALSEPERKKYFEHFLCGDLAKSGKVTSRDGALTVPQARKLARKPLQRCRISGSRTRQHR